MSSPRRRSRPLLGVALALAVLTGALLPSSAAAVHGSYSFVNTWYGGQLMQAPNGADVDSVGNVYLADSTKNVIQKYSPTGMLLAEWGSTGTTAGQFQSPSAVAVGSGDIVYVADRGNNRVQRFSSSGNFVSMWGWGVTNGTNALQVCSSGCQVGFAGSGVGQLNGPRGIASFGSSIWVSDTNNGRIVRYSNTGVHQVTWGTFGSGAGQFNGPFGLHATSTNVYVADYGNNRVQRFDLNGNFLGNWGVSGSGNGQFNGPFDVAVSATSVYVADGLNQRIQRFTTTGGYVSKWGSIGTADGQFTQPYGLAYAPLTDEVHVIDAAGSPFVRVQTFSSAGTFVRDWGFQSSARATLATPYDVAIGPSGTLYVADSFNHRIMRFDPGGNYIGQWGSSGTAAGQFATPSGLEIDSAGNVYVADTQNNRIQKFTSTGTFIAAWGWGVQNGAAAYQICTSGCQVGTTGTGDGRFTMPNDIALDSSDNVYVAERLGSRVQKFSSTGTYLTKWGSNGSGNGQFSLIWGVAVDKSSGNVFVSDTGNDRIQKFSSTGTYLTKWGGVGTADGQFTDPGGMVVNDDGEVFVGDAVNNRIQKFTAYGGFLTKWGTIGNTGGQMIQPRGVALDANGNVFAAISASHRISRFDFSPSLSLASPLLTDWAGNMLDVDGTPDANLYGTF